MLPWVIGVVVAAVALMVFIEALITRLGIRPDAPEDKAGGFADILRKVEQWQSGRRPRS